MREMYGAQWTHGEEPSMGWHYALRDLNQEQLRRGVDNLCKRDDNHWPPNAPEFHDLCLMDMDWEHKQLKYYQPDTLLERKRTDEENAQGSEKLKSIMEML
jgi:hypothetical protein